MDERNNRPVTLMVERDARHADSVNDRVAGLLSDGRASLATRDWEEGTRNSLSVPSESTRLGVKRSKSISDTSSNTSSRVPRRLSFQEAIEQNAPIRSKDSSTRVSTETLKQMRWLRAMGKRHDRTTTHLEKFTRLRVEVDRPKVEFTVIVDKTLTVEYLSHLIEAEYAFKYLLPEKTDHNEEFTIVDVLPLECGLIFDEDMVSLQYSDKVEEVLDLDSKIHVMNAFEGLQTSIEPKFQAAVTSFMEDVDDDTEDNAIVNPLLTAFRRSSIRNTFKPTTQQSRRASEVAKEKIPEETGKLLLAVKEGESEEDELKVAEPLERKISNRSFKGFRTYSMVGATLDDRLQAVLRNTVALDAFQEFCIDEYCVENLIFWLSVEVFQSAPDDLQNLHASFIYQAFIAESAPLRINLSQEVLRDIHIQKGRVDPMLFDEAQQHVYSILKGYSFVRFERSAKWTELMKLRTTDVELYKQSTISVPYFDVFNIPNTLLLLLSNQFETLQTNEQDNMSFKDNALNQIVQTFFPLSKYIPIEGYFSDPTRLSLVKKKRKIHKEKKISKFFGERPSFEQLQRQLAAANFPQAGLELSLALTLGVGVGGSGAEQDGGETSGGKRKKVEKLSEFFGTNLGKLELKSQHLAGGKDFVHESDEEDLDEEPIETVNDLDPTTKRQLTKRNKKLVAMLGETNVHEAGLKKATSRSFTNLKDAGPAPADAAEGDGNDSTKDAAPSSSSSDAARTSLNSLNSIERDMQSLEKEMRLKKLRKLSAFLGETTGVIGAAEQELKQKAPCVVARSPMTLEEKQVSLWRASKLEKVLGEVVPSNLVHTTSETEQRRKSYDSHHVVPMSPREFRRLSDISSLRSNSQDFPAVPKPARKSIAAVETVIPTFTFTTDDSSVKNLDLDEDVKEKESESRNSKSSTSRRGSIASLHHENLKRISALLDDNKVERVLDIMDQMVEYDLDLKEKMENSESNPFSTNSPTSPPSQSNPTSAKKTNRQRKLQKLNKFFGSKLNTIQLFEQSLVADIEKDLEDEALDPKEREVLRQELEKVRAQIANKSSELRQGLENRAMRELRAEGIPPGASHLREGHSAF
ncbi:hypothetical protein HDU97_009926 [Phlyctochytrium planicorne]|nr:hypothetical protein HDU97_009926 [Phlyctochytrium planicorne]